jgi:lipid II:glycine glycyltransferase (peptidoglycan interpeptide bridge formation enzyme)
MWHAGIPEGAWDMTEAHFLQTRPWAEFNQALGKQIFYAFGDGWSWLAFQERGKFGKRLYCPCGPTAHSLEALRTALGALASCAKAHQISYVRVESQGAWSAETLRSLGLKPAHRNIQPRFTLIQSLMRSEDELMADMTATNRNLYRTATKKGISFRESQDVHDLPILLKFLHAMAVRNHIVIHNDEYFTTMAKTLFSTQAARLFIAEIHQKPAAAALVFESSTTRYYAHAAADDEFRKLHPGSPLVAHMVFTAKEQGLKYFDFNGVASPTATADHPWAGLTRFKKSFGGEVVDMGGTWELPIKKFNHLLYRSLAKLGN